jgi:hypothetical protein
MRKKPRNWYKNNTSQFLELDKSDIDQEVIEETKETRTVEELIKELAELQAKYHELEEREIA